jgi:hypothetical protein
VDLTKRAEWVRALMLGVVLIGFAGGLARPTWGQTLNIGWDACGSGGLTNKDFACDTNAGVTWFVVSFTLPELSEPVSGVGTSVWVRAADYGVLPSWWALGSGGCRSEAWRVTHVALEGEDCQPWSWAVTDSAFEYSGGNEWGGAFAVSAGSEGEWLLAGVEYVAARFGVLHNRSTGTDSCAGCSRAMVLHVSYVQLMTPTTSYMIYDDHPLRRAEITWQGSSVPVIQQSWGQIKSLYR